MFSAVSRKIRKLLTKAKDFNITEAERAKFIVEKAEQDKKRLIIRAQREAKSSELIGQAIVDTSEHIPWNLAVSTEIGKILTERAGISRWWCTVRS
ncbi:hypothetical protein ZWY2020_019169 [Hordeum vulgare]|nr:hypothetical protein ZWY2020_019169 [Hordeum vulgare]